MRLYINLDHVATVREARATDEPDPVRAAVLAELGGADGVTVHLREDRRHIRERDVELLLATCRTAINLELSAQDEIVGLAEGWRPAQATLVPERRQELTTEGGLDLDAGRERIAVAVNRLRAAGIRTSLFIDPDESAVDAAAEIGSAAVELHTGEYANACDARGREAGVVRLRAATQRARAAGLAVHAGHGLTYENVAPVAAIEGVEELNIGHSVVSRAVLVGLERAVREMAEIVRRVRQGG